MVIVAFGMWAERRSWGQRLGGPLLLLAVSMALANLGVIPHAAPLYGTIASFLVPAAIPLLLLRADLGVIFSESGPMLIAFLVAAAATLAGALVGVLIVDMGAFEPQLAGTIAASYIGGSLNFVATAEAVGIKDSSVYVVGLSADAVGAVFFLAVIMLLPTLAFVRRAIPSKFSFAENHAEPIHAETGAGGARDFDMARASYGIAISLVICALSKWIVDILDIASLYILVVTALSVLVANVAKPLIRQVRADFEIGTLFMYVFFVAIGAGADVAVVLGAALPVLLFIVVMVSVHIVLIVLLGRILKLDLAELMIASNACILGPAPAAALAASRGWQSLVAPGILVGIFGYAIATFLGVFLAKLLGA